MNSNDEKDLCISTSKWSTKCDTFILVNITPNLPVFKSIAQIKL